MSSKVTKKLHLIRHELVAHIPDHEQVDPYEWDSDLSAKGHQQVKELGLKVQQIKLEPELILSSPLTRALKTTYGGFGTPESAPIIVNALAREQVENACDIGTPLSDLAPVWTPHRYDLKHIQQEIWWYTPTNDITRHNYKDMFRQMRWHESDEDVQGRIRQLEHWIGQREEREIVVVGHSSFIKAWTKMDRKLYNCEIYTMEMTFDA